MAEIEETKEVKFSRTNNNNNHNSCGAFDNGNEEDSESSFELD